MKRLRLLLTLGASAVLLSGCTLVATANAPAPITKGAVPFGLLGKSIPGTNRHVQFITQPVYIVDATGHLAPSSRIVPSPPSLDSVLRELVLGPTDIETSAGFTSALPKSLVILEATIKDGVGEVSLAHPLSSLPSAQEVLAIGQLVFTAHSVGATGGLQILVGGVAAPLLMPNGRLKTLVTEKDYQSLLNA